MKSLYNRLNIILTIFFILGILFSAFNLYNLPTQLEQQSKNIDLSIISEIKPVLNQTYVIVGVTLLLGLLSTIIYLFLLNYSKTVEKIIYVEKTESQKRNDDQKELKLAQEKHDKLLNDLKSDLDTIKNKQKRYERVLSSLCMKLEASQGIVYNAVYENEKRYLELYTSFAFTLPDSGKLQYEFGEGLAGQVAKEGRKVNIKDVPDGYITIISGLGKATPGYLAIIPVKENDQVIRVVEIASFKEISAEDEKLIEDAFNLKELEEEAQTGKDINPKASKKEIKK